MSAGSLSDRIRGVVRPAPQVTPASSPQPASVPQAPQIPFHPIEQVLDGAWHTHGASRCFIVERTESAESWHGSVQVGDLAERLAGAAGDAPLLADGAPARLPFVFFDLETTGLSGGAGTLAFLVGCGWFDADGAFLTRQYVLARAGDERPMLQVLAEQLATAGALVSFNGKSFDAPLLESRFLFHRLEWLGARLPHVDILHPARRFWRTASPGRRNVLMLALRSRTPGAGLPDGAMMCRDTTRRRDIFSSCVQEMHECSPACWPTTGSIYCRWPGSRRSCWALSLTVPGERAILARRSRLVESTSRQGYSREHSRRGSAR